MQFLAVTGLAGYFRAGFSDACRDGIGPEQSLAI